MLATARTLAQQSGERLYLVGGAVRDLLLRRSIRDVDLALEGGAVAFAQALASRLGAAAQTHPRFATAIVTLADGRRLDLASTRRESYEHPGALPEVSVGVSIEEDLVRRDFTVNAIALEIAPGRRLVDPLGGRADLARGVLRALHARSFFDDPTRALRGIRYGARLGFSLAPEARRDIARAVAAGSFDAVSGQRLAREIALLLSEADPGGAVAKLRRLGVGGAITPALAGDAGAPARVRAAEAIGREEKLPVGWLCYLLAWMGATEDSATLADRLALAGREGRCVRAWPATSLRLAGEPELAKLNEGVSLDEVVAAAAGAGKATRRALLSAVAGAPVGLVIAGADLVAAGISPGPAIGAALAETLSARKAGRIVPAQELAFALAAARRKPGQAQR